MLNVPKTNARLSHKISLQLYLAVAYDNSVTLTVDPIQHMNFHETTEDQESYNHRNNRVKALIV